MINSIAVVADLHARGKDLPDFSAQWQECIRQAEEKGCKNMVVCGDVFDRETILDRYAKTGSIIDAVKRPMIESSIHFHVVAGNHDVTGLGSGDALSCLDGQRGVTVYRHPVVIEIEGERCAMMPWLYDGRSPAPVLTDLYNEGEPCRWAFGHCQILGQKLNAIATAKEGSFTLDPEEFFLIGYEAGFFGDFHHAASLVRADGKSCLYIPGGLRQMNFGEAGNHCRWMLLSTDGEVEDCPLYAASVYRVIDCNDAKDADDVRKKIEYGAHRDHLRRIEIPQGILSQADIAELEAQGIDVQLTGYHNERLSRVSIQDVDNTMTSLPYAFELWADNQQPPIDGEQRERCLRILKETEQG